MDHEDDSLKPRKVSLEQVEVLDQQGHVLREGKNAGNARGGETASPFGNTMQFRMIKGGPLGLLLIPLLIPFVLIGVVLLFFLAIFMGRSVFRVLRSK
jgi:hypothetical protein